MTPWRARLVGLASLLSLLSLGGCIHRQDLTPADFERLRGKDPELQELRVLPKRKLRSFYAQRDYESSVAVTRSRVRVRGEKRQHQEISGRNTSGQIVAIEELNSMPLLWVNFNNECKKTPRECAHGFVLTELGFYSLVSVPELDSFKTPTNYRRTKLKRNRLRLLKQRSLTELNEVLGVARKIRRKVLTIDLQYRKDSYQPTKKTRRRNRGV